MPSDRPPSPDKGLWAGVNLAMELPFVMVAGVVVGGGIGYLLDRWLHTSPAITLIFGALGFAGGIWEIIRRLSSDEKSGGGGGQG